MRVTREEREMPAQERLVSLRVRKGWTTYRLAKNAKVDVSSLYKMQDGVLGISKKAARKLADAFGIANPAALLDL